MTHPVLSPGAVAVITGGASGIGFAAARRFIQLGLNVCIADIVPRQLQQATDQLVEEATHGEQQVLAQLTDVQQTASIKELEAAVLKKFGKIDILMNNAGIQWGSHIFGTDEQWYNVLETNLWGVIRCSQLLIPGMLQQQTPGLVINTGSKQGITTPPGDPAYNVAKSGVKAFTEALQHDLRNRENCQLTAHLFIPGFVFTPLSSAGCKEKPDAAWTAEQTIDFMLPRLEAGDFYILCPDGEVTRDIDQQRILWAANDIIANRPPLSRWHPDFKKAFAEFIKKNK